MSTEYFKLSTGTFEQTWTGAALTTDNWANVGSVMGYRGDDLTIATGVDPRTLTQNDTARVVDVNVATATQNPNNFSTGGVAYFGGTDPTIALTGSGTADAPYVVVYLDATARQNLHLDVDIRDIEGVAGSTTQDNAVQQVAVQYRVGDTGVWKNLPGGYVADATDPGAGKVTKLSLDLPAELNGQGQVQIRFMTTNAVGNDEWVGIDNIKVSSQELPGALVTVSDVSVVEGDSGDKTVTFTVARTETGGAFTVDYGTVNGTATAGSDYEAVSGTLTFEAGGPASQTVTVTIHGDQQIEFDETFALTLSNLQTTQGLATLLKPTGTATIENDEAVRIGDIQGAGHTSPFVGKKVITEGVITAFDSNGFYIQDGGDGNAATSDGVFVFTRDLAGLAVGDKVKVAGTVEEFNGGNPNNLPITELVSPTVTVLGHGHSVAPTVIGAGGLKPPTEVIEDDNYASFDPTTDGIDFYESIEGMLVTIKDAQATSVTKDGSTWVVADSGASATGTNDRGGITISEGDMNPDKIQIYADLGVNPGFNASYVMGDKLGDVTGVVSYFGGNYQVAPISVGSTATKGVASRETTSLTGSHDHVTIATYNVENLDPTDSAAKFELLARDIAQNLKSPDIIGLNEIQDADGKGNGPDLSGTATLQKLADAIVAAGGPRYSFIEIAPTVPGSNGGEGGGNIRQAFLYNADRVQYLDGSIRQITDATPANGDTYANSRKPLVADFMFHGEKITAIDVHNYARSGGESLFGLHQPPSISGEARREEQVQHVRDYLQKLLQADPAANVVLMGDFNGFYWEAAQTQLEGVGMFDLGDLLPNEDRYSYVFEGSSQQLDLMYVSPNLKDGAAFDMVHINTGQPEYVGQQLVRPTDHDPSVSRLYVNTAPVAVAEEAYAAAEDTNLTVAAAQGVLANDTDLNKDVLQAVLKTGPAHGKLTLNADGSFVYTPDADYNGADSFTYVAKDPSGATSGEVTVKLQVAAVNDAPVAVADAGAVAEDGKVVIDVLVNDTDVDAGDTKTLSVGATSAKGASISIDNGKVAYVADADAFDLLTEGQTVIDTFTYTVTDAAGATSTATVTVVVTGVADGVTRTAGNGASVLEGTALDEALVGGNGDDKVSGGEGADTVSGQNGADRLFGDAGSDKLDGGAGADTLNGGAGSDVLIGGKGGDLFVFTGSFGQDVIADFGGDDLIQLDKAQFASVAEVLGQASQQGADVVIQLATGSITLSGVALNSLNAGDFLLA
jgi:VCBS repeat-containing protein